MWKQSELILKHSVLNNVLKSISAGFNNSSGENEIEWIQKF